jgi:hypothetical protein
MVFGSYAAAVTRLFLVVPFRMLAFIVVLLGVLVTVDQIEDAQLLVDRFKTEILKG